MAIREVFISGLFNTMDDFKIVSWQKAPGDKVYRGDIIVVVERDKAEMDIETFYDGYIATIIVPEGGWAAPSAVIALVAETEAEIEAAKQQAQGYVQPAAAPAPATAPSAPAPATAEPISSERAVASIPKQVLRWSGCPIKLVRLSSY